MEKREIVVCIGFSERRLVMAIYISLVSWGY